MLLSRWLLCLFLALFLCSLPSLADNLAGRGLNTTDFMLATTLGNAVMIGEANDHTRAKTEAGIDGNRASLHDRRAQATVQGADADGARPSSRQRLLGASRGGPARRPRTANSAAGYQQQADAAAGHSRCSPPPSSSPLAVVHLAARRTHLRRSKAVSTSSRLGWCGRPLLVARGRHRAMHASRSRGSRHRSALAKTACASKSGS